MRRRQRSRVVFQPAVYQDMQRGINQIVEAVRPTLGPQPRTIAIEHAHRTRMPDLLDDGGVIVRRIIEIADSNADAGAMFARHVLWQVHEQVGDGAATTAVLLQEIYNQGVRYIVAGGNPMGLRRHLQAGRDIILDQLNAMTVPVTGKDALAQVAESICYDPDLARLIGEIFDIIGEYGQLDIRAGRSRELKREYVEGMYWEGGLVSREMITNWHKLRTDLENAAVLISDLTIENPRELIPVLEATRAAGKKALLLIAETLSPDAVTLLRMASREPEKFQAIAVRSPGKTTGDQAAAMADLAVLTGGRALVKIAGHTLARVRAEDLGRARRVWADMTHFGIIGSKGNPRALRAHIASLRAAHQRASETEARQKLQGRIGKLMGGSATLWVGATTELEIDARKALAERTAAALRGAVREGVTPGGGVALLDCQATLRERLSQTVDSDERAACRILISSLEMPIRAILANAGYDPAEVMPAIRRAGPGYGFDVRTGQVTDMAAAGIWDSAAVLRTVVNSAVTAAALALTIGALVHHKRPEQSMAP